MVLSVFSTGFGQSSPQLAPATAQVAQSAVAQATAQVAQSAVAQATAQVAQSAAAQATAQVAQSAAAQATAAPIAQRCWSLSKGAENPFPLSLSKRSGYLAIQSGRLA